MSEETKKKGGFFGKFIALLLGFILGIIAGLGGLVGAGYYIAKKKTPKDLFDLAKVDYSSYLTEEYATKTVWDMLGATWGAVKGLSGNGTFGNLAAISPLVEDKISAFANSAKETYGVELNADGALMNVPFSKLNEHIRDCIKNTPASEMFAKFGSGNKVLTALCYGVENEDYIVVDGEILSIGSYKPMTVGDFAGEGLAEQLKRLPLDSIMEVKTTDKITCTLAYGQEHRYTITDGKVTMNQRKYTLVETTEAKTFFDEDGKQVECTALQDGDIYKLTFADESVQYLSKTAYVIPETEQTQPQSVEENAFYYVYSDEACKAPVRYKKTTIGDLQDDSAAVINNISLKDALSVTPQSHSMLIALACGEENVHFDYVYNQTTGEKTDIQMKTPPRTIGDLRTNSKGLIDDIYLTSIITPKTDNKIIMYLLYGREGVHYELKDGQPKPLQKQVGVFENKVYNEYGELIANAAVDGLNYIQYADDNTTELARYKLSAIAGKTIAVTVPPATQGGESTKMDAPAYYVFNTDDTKVEYTRTQMRDMTGDSNHLSRLTERMLLTDVVDVHDNKILKHLTNVTIAELPTAVNTLTVGQVFDEDMHNINENGYYYLNENKEQITVSANEKYLALKPTWKYLLRANVTNAERYPETDLALARAGNLEGVYYFVDNQGNERFYDYRYTVTHDMNLMVKNIEHNMQYTPLKEMNEDGIIEGNHITLINKPISDDIKKETDVFDAYTSLGDLTIDQLLNYVNLYIELKEPAKS